MKTTLTLPTPAISVKSGVKNYLIKGIIYLTSEKFSIFVAITSALTEYIGVLADCDRVISTGCIFFAAGMMPRALREAAAGIRREKLGHCSDKW